MPAFLLLEDTRNEVGTVARQLSKSQRLLDLRPLRVTRHGDEKVRLAQALDDRHGVVVLGENMSTISLRSISNTSTADNQGATRPELTTTHVKEDVPYTHNGRTTR